MTLYESSSGVPIEDNELPIQVPDTDPNQIGHKRLLTLAVFLKTRITDALFDYRSFVKFAKKAPGDALLAGGGCGTTACAVGWVPAIWPEEFCWAIGDDWHSGDQNWNRSGGYVVRRVNGDPFLPTASLTMRNQANENAVTGWFGITESDANYLFIPCGGQGHDNGLGENATREQVADGIIDFVERRIDEPDCGMPNLNCLDEDDDEDSHDEPDGQED